MRNLLILRDRLKRGNSPQCSDQLVRVEWDIREQENRRDIRILHLARLLYDAYWKDGSMTVMLNDGRRITDRPIVGGSKIQHIWNARDKAVSLATLSVDSEESTRMDGLGIYNGCAKKS